jgi:hypothetical protein
MTETIQREGVRESIQIEDTVIRYFNKNSVEGIDMAQLFRCCGDGNICLDSLNSYTAHMPLLMKDLEFQMPLEDYFADNSFSDEDESLKQYAITAHGIKRASYGITAYRAGQAAEELEQAALEGNIEFIRLGTPDFIFYMEDFIDSLEKFTRRARGFKPVHTMPDAEFKDAAGFN